MAAREQRDPTTAKMRRFAVDELNALIVDLATDGLRTSQQDVVGALVLAARAYPLDAVKAAITLYIQREVEEDEAAAPAANAEHAADEGDGSAAADARPT